MSPGREYDRNVTIVLLVLGLFASCLGVAATLWISRACRRPVLPDCADPRDSEIINPCEPGVSVVIAARNEEDAIKACLYSVLDQQRVIEVIVVDDHSSDGTSTVVQGVAARDKRVKLVPAPELPLGWVGKNHALDVGSRLCCGEYILFTDADVLLQGNVVSSTLSYMRSHDLDHVSGMFRLKCGTVAEQICCPVLAAIALMALLVAARKSGAGTGAFNMLRRSTYESLGRHSRIHNCVVDDVSLARLVKERGHASTFLDLSQHVSVRLFRGFKGYWAAVGRSAIPFLTNSPGVAVILALLTLPAAATLAIAPLAGTALGVLAIWGAGTGVGGIALFECTVYLLGALPFWVSRRCHDGAWYWTALYPVPLMLMIVSVFSAACRTLRGKPVIWRGRQYVSVR